MTSPSPRLRRAGPVWALPAAMAVLSLFAAAWLALQPPAPGAAARPLALVFPPWWSATRALQAAAQAGAIIRLGATGNIVIIAPYAAAPLAATGAWFVLNPQALGGCGGSRIAATP